MKHALLIPAALVAFQAQAAAPVALPITQANHASWMRSIGDMKAGEKTIAILSHDVSQGSKVIAPKGCKILGSAAKDGAGATFTSLVLPDGSQVAIEPFTIKGLLKEGE